MMFEGKFNRAMEWLKQQNKDKKGDSKQEDGDQEDLKLERADIIALMFAALLVFGPIVLCLIAIAVLVWLT